MSKHEFLRWLLLSAAVAACDEQEQSGAANAGPDGGTMNDSDGSSGSGSVGGGDPVGAGLGGGASSGTGGRADGPEQGGGAPTGAGGAGSGKGGDGASSGTSGTGGKQSGGEATSGDSGAAGSNTAGSGAGGEAGSTDFPEADPIGCSDGTREGFSDLAGAPLIAGCSGGFELTGLNRGVVPPPCGNDAGNSSDNPEGTGCGPDDLCSPGWHVCEDPLEVAAKSPSGGCEGAASAGSNLFFAVRGGQVATDDSCGAGADDLHGCGTLGAAPADDDCAPLDRTSGDLCAALGSPWSCGTDADEEAINATKSGASGGGVLCCRNPGAYPPAADDPTTFPSGPVLSVSRHACAISETRLRCWGANEHGQAGGVEAIVSLPVEIPGSWIAVSAGETHSCGVQSDGSLWCWGSNERGALGIGHFDEVDVETPQHVADGFRYVATGRNVSCAIGADDGKLWCWGSSDGGALAEDCPPDTTCTGGRPDAASPIAVRAIFEAERRYSSVAIFEDNLRAVREGTHPDGIEAVFEHVLSWGGGSETMEGALTASFTLDSITAVELGASLECSVRTQTGGPDAVGVTPRPKDFWNRLFCSSRVGGAPPPFDGTDGAIALAVGDDHVCITRADQNVYCAGANDRGQLGQGRWDWDGELGPSDDWQAVPLPGSGWSRVSSFGATTCALHRDGAVWCWGDNSEGALGNGTTDDSSVPTEVGVPSPATCDDGVANGSETDPDCGGLDCIACPTCSDALKNQDESDVDCGGATCSARCDFGDECFDGSDCGCMEDAIHCEEACTANVCTPWCDDPDDDDYGVGPGCLGPDCTPDDPLWTTGCTCSDGAENQDETDVDCGGSICSARCAVGQKCNSGADCGCSGNSPECAAACAGGLCVGWCIDPDGDDHGEGPNCLSSDCDQSDPDWQSNCWVRDLFPPERPATVTVTGTVSRDDWVCVMVGGPCVPQNDPACVASVGQESIELELTIEVDGTFTIEAPQQEMCSQDYFCGVTGPSCPAAVPDSFELPVITTQYSYDPRPQDNCRIDSTNTPIPVTQLVDASISGSQIRISQRCDTQMINHTTVPASYVFDQREWRTTIDLEDQ